MSDCQCDCYNWDDDTEPSLLLKLFIYFLTYQVIKYICD